MGDRVHSSPLEEEDELSSSSELLSETCTSDAIRLGTGRNCRSLPLPISLGNEDRAMSTSWSSSKSMSFSSSSKVMLETLLLELEFFNDGN